ncbi:hypothetical protein ACI2OX_14005 [Bacillus sp. N9]
MFHRETSNEYVSQKNQDRQRLAVLQLELNYELAVLFDALQEGNEEMKLKSKQKLKKSVKS